MLLKRLKQLTDLKQRMVQREHDIIDTQIAIEEMLDAKAREEGGRTILPDYFGLQPEEPEALPVPEELEALPVPAAMIHHANQQQPGKRQGTNAGCKYRECAIVSFGTKSERDPCLIALEDRNSFALLIPTYRTAIISDLRVKRKMSKKEKYVHIYASLSRAFIVQNRVEHAS